MITISNVSQSLKFKNTLNVADFNTKQSSQRLSTGYRINSAADDSSGFTIAAGLTKSIRGTEIANQNALTAKSYVQLADSATVSMLDVTYTIKDLASQALATTDSAKRAELQTLANKFVDQMYGIQSSAKFGEQKIFEEGGATTKPITFQIGTDTSSTSKLNMDMALNVSGLTVNFSSDEAIEQTMDDIDAISEKLEEKSAYFAANQNVLDNAVSYQELSYTNLTEARGRIVDTNVADELYRFAKAQISAETTSSLMQQCANLNASVVLRLIGV